MKSRKTIILIIAILTAIVGFVQEDFALIGNPTAVIAAVGIALMYVFGEAKLDLARIREKITQEKKFRDPKFWVALVGVVIVPINENLGLGIPADVIQGFLAVLLPVLFGLIFKKHV